MSRLAYVDTSALVKLAVREPETAALERDLITRAGLVCSRLGATELQRACGRVGGKRLLQQADDVIASLFLVEVTPSILEVAGRLSPSALRTLDAVHLATLLSLGEPDLDVITYDDRLGRAARAAGFDVYAPH